MSAATRALAALVALAAVAGCGSESEQNILITNEVPANAEIEVLPADESVGTTTDELDNGVADPGVNGVEVNGG